MVVVIFWCFVSKICDKWCCLFFYIYEFEIFFWVINIIFKFVYLVLLIFVIYYVFICILNFVRSSCRVNLENSYIFCNSSVEKFVVDVYKCLLKIVIILFIMFLFCLFFYLGVMFYLILMGNYLMNVKIGFVVYFILFFKWLFFFVIYIFRNRMIVSYL